MPIRPLSRSSGRSPDEALRVLAQLASIATPIERELKRQFDMSRNEYHVLIILERGPLPQKSLCVHTQSTPAAVSRWLTRLDREGWVNREHADNNQRDFISHLSRRGVNQLRRIRGHLAEQLRPVADVLSPEDEHVLRQLERNMIGLLQKTSDSNDPKPSQ